MADKKYLNEEGLAEVAVHINRRLKVVSVMPVSASDGAVRLYTGTTDTNFISGHIYQYSQIDAEWKDITTNDVPHWSGTMAQYEADKDNIPEGAYVALTDDIDQNYESGDYSLNEINTGKRWINGKPIYRKVLSQNREASGSWAFSETISNVDKFIKIELLTHGSNNYQEADDSYYYYVRANLNNSSTNTYQIQCFQAAAYNLSGTQYCILEYTKTTD